MEQFEERLKNLLAIEKAYRELTQTSGGMLTGKEIIRRREIGDIVIEPWDLKNLNPNSYDITLDPHAKKYILGDKDVLDPRKVNPTEDIIIPKEGLILRPGDFLLAKTMEWTETRNLVPRIDGRSSTGRLSIFIHVTAGFGDINFNGNWTLEIACIKPVILYPGMKIGQISYVTPSGEIDPDFLYGSARKLSKYQGSRDAEGSLFALDSDK